MYQYILSLKGAFSKCSGKLIVAPIFEILVNCETLKYTQVKKIILKKQRNTKVTTIST
jgi:hypothetical protein